MLKQMNNGDAHNEPDFGQWCALEIRRLARLQNGVDILTSLSECSPGVKTRCFELALIYAHDEKDADIEVIAKELGIHDMRAALVNAELLDGGLKKFKDISAAAWKAFSEAHKYPDQLQRFAKTRDSFDYVCRRPGLLAKEDAAKISTILRVAAEHSIDVDALSTISGVIINELTEDVLRRLDSSSLHRLAIACIGVDRALTKQQRVKVLITLDASVNDALSLLARSSKCTKSSIVEDALKAVLM